MCGLHQLDDNHLGAIAAAGTQLVDAGIAAGAALFLVAGTILGAQLTEKLFDHGMLVILGALLEIALD